MAKAMLISEMPSSCDVCDYVLDGKENSLVCGIPSCGMYVTDYIGCRPKFCPLREVPQKQNICGTYNSEYFKNGGKPASFKVGYNACIDEILGGAENG